MKEKMDENKPKKIPPDGGWGWVVCFAYALNNVIVLPLISGFGLIFQQTFDKLGISATNTSVIITVNYAFGMVLALFNGPLLRRFGYRKVSVVGSLLVSIGILLTSVGNSFLHFIITYSLMTSIGVALVMSSFSLAINSYFNKNRGKAMGIGMSITGLGPILMPQLINALMIWFGVQGAVMILSALSMHCIVAALLLRPVKWYLKDPENDIENCDTTKKEEDLFIKEKMQDVKKSIEYVSENEEDYLENTLNDDASSKSLDVNSKQRLKHTKSKSNPDLVSAKSGESKLYKWWKPVSEINLASSENIFKRDDSIENVTHMKVLENGSVGNLKRESSAFLPNKVSEVEKKKTFSRKVVEFFDLDLLRDPVFVNIMLGISIAACAEINFSLLTPFILRDLNFTTAEIAAVLSVIACADIVFRFISPFIGEWCRKSARVMYLMSLCMLIFTRTTLFFATTYQAMLFVGLGLGIAKGVRTVYMAMVIPNYVPIERLPFASSIQMVTNGFIIMTIGPLMGYLRDKSGSYNISIIFINVITSITIVMWIVEYVYIRHFTKKAIATS
ncbi:uncharacterized protein LOC143911764 isoform X2 [Arctopsyche grandis]|uniref:uncharacterized protein LOC143911764 isoform X2 n=1 Tax=Arctopsyche grandis TaxID=121162 RepID=UPI00406D9CDA